MLKAIVGLPGSGKSRLMTAQKGYIILDDMGDDRTWGQCAWHKNKLLAKNCLDLAYNVIVSDVGFCRDEERAKFQSSFPDVQWVFFDNNKEACIENVTRRNSEENRTHSLQDELRTIEDLSAIYHPVNPSERCFIHVG